MKRTHLKELLPQEVYSVIESMQSYLNELLKDKLLGIYLHGSIATGHFNPPTSDIDYVVVLSEPLTDREFLALREIHGNINEAEPYWGRRLEGSYLTEDMLACQEPPTTPRAYLNGGELRWEQYGWEWVFEKYILREHGVVVQGKSLKSVLEPVSGTEIRDAAKQLLTTWWQPLIEERPETLTEEYCIYGILTMCRIRNSIVTGEVHSKTESVDWMMNHISERQKSLIALAVDWEVGKPFDHKAEAIAFIKETIGGVVYVERVDFRVE